MVAIIKKKQALGCIVDMIIPINLVCILFGPTIPTSPFNFIVFYTCNIWIDYSIQVFYIYKNSSTNGVCGKNLFLCSILHGLL